MAYVGYKGKYSPKHPEKYLGDFNNITYRSLLERRFMVFLDNNPDVQKWGSEEVTVPYISPLDGKVHKYYIDFVVKTLNKAGILECRLVEVKPKNQTVEPVLKKKSKSKSFLYAIKTWAVNQAKWEAAKNLAKHNGWTFMLLTEEQLK